MKRKIIALIMAMMMVVPVNAIADEELHIIHKDFKDPDIPYNIQSCAEMIGDQYGICPELLESIAWHESGYRPEITVNEYYGLMMLCTKCNRKRYESLGYTKEDLLEVYPNLEVAASLLKDLFDKYEDPEIVLKKYNGDTSKGTSKYVTSVLEMSAELEAKHNT